ncbi:EscR/YscR/HrcR family type III secretion system export apparatus protein [Luteimonas sp. 3794]|uniref:EscR/YscR/HrcR family type III secretion system export apparatus protein n=1 Tax=Luteimonas sp. 3794 TaxID=2817730 RepID=UPI00285B7EFD|nr:EscR/YscR/HrcR family type III secretion system export apparatus protein [Luteimonas sp. 3794]MDR6993174.1 type III secretory pathway component EscR [Luteimonas sp. 3794]
MDFSTFSPALVLVTVVSLALAPFVAVMVTSFTKIVVVLSLLRNALGLQQVPPNVVINGLAIVLSIYVMYPVILDVQDAVNARLEGRPPPASVQRQIDARAQQQAIREGRPIDVRPAAAAPAAEADAPAPTSPAAADALAAEAQAQGTPADVDPMFAAVRGGSSNDPREAEPAEQPTGLAEQVTAPGAAAGSAPAAAGGSFDTNRMLLMIDAGKEPLRTFLIQHSSDSERAFFLRSVQRMLPPERRDGLTPDDFIVIVPAFTVSELTAAFQIGFLIFLPFLIIDLVVANILLALGMMMLSPTTVSLPFKLLLFVLIDGWAKLVHGLVLTYGVTT